MTKTTKPGARPLPAGTTKLGSGDQPEIKSPTSAFLMAALDMSWRLAIIVLVPIIGGFELDKRLRTTPAFLILGFLLAGAGTAVILKQTLDRYSPVEPPKKGSRS